MCKNAFHPRYRGFLIRHWVCEFFYVLFNVGLNLSMKFVFFYLEYWAVIDLV